MSIEERLKFAEKIAKEMNSATIEVGSKDKRLLVRGIDDNELKKMYAFLCKHKDINKLFNLIESLIKSPYAQRSRRTEGYYRNIQNILQRNKLKLPSSEEVIFILGWVCRLLKFYYSPVKVFSGLGKHIQPTRRAEEIQRELRRGEE
jgi:hypothetical protein